MEKKKSNAGRKSNYATKVLPYLEEIRAWRQEGQTEEIIAKFLGVSYTSFNEYKVKYPELMQTLKESKEKLIHDLEDTLFRVALGKVKTIKSKKIYIKDHRTGEMKLDKEEVQEDTLAPNATLLIFSLKNLNSSRWKDRHDIDVSKDSELQEAMNNFKLVSDELTKHLEDKTDE